jgi:hypothetical protein
MAGDHVACSCCKVLLKEREKSMGLSDGKKIVEVELPIC